ncbi:PLANT/PROTEIN [Salix viminalis]|uniref:PLANT/PROTEIN n=1 Tax=Salix viminalis TaxID=40686 RepID=A0A6N2NKS8_SALVM|nr:PLANT/PROTEIN [Salix viminalis]
MDSLTSVSPSMVLPLPLRRRRVLKSSSFSANNRQLLPPRISSFSSASHPLEFSRRSSRSRRRVSCRLASGSGDGDGDAKEEDNSNDDGSEEVERALHLDGTIPGTSNEFVKQVSSRAYDMRRHLQQSFDSSSYDVLDANPWRETSKPVYVLTQRENQLCTMKTRTNRSEVEKELGLLFSKGGKWRSEIGSQAKQSRRGTKFQMLVEDVRDGVLVFEDENEAVRYCDLLQGGGKGCEGVAEIEASSVFDLCQKMRALAVLFRRGRTPPLPQSLELNLRARQRSLEDQEDSV